MADIELVIKITEHDKNVLERYIDETGYNRLPTNVLDAILEAVNNGTPLPKGHGDLVDRNDLKYERYNSYAYAIANAPTIIEADGLEVWNGIHAQVTAPQGTFEKIWNDAKEDIDETI